MSQKVHFQATIEALQEFDVEAAAVVRAAGGLKETDWRHLMRMEGFDSSTKRKLYMKFAVKRWCWNSFSQPAADGRTSMEAFYVV